MTENVSGLRLEKSAIIESLINDAIDIVHQKYGQDGEHPLDYHNEQHTLEVIRAVEEIAGILIEQGKISSDSLHLLRLAAAYHDTVQGLPGGANEKESADLATKGMRKMGIFSDDEIAIVRRLIMGTVMQNHQGRLIQSAGEDILAQVLADADLAPLGMPQEVFWQHAIKFWRETSGQQDMTDSQHKEFLEAEISFLSGHSFYTSAAKELYPHQQSNLQWLIETQSSI